MLRANLPCSEDENDDEEASEAVRELRGGAEGVGVGNVAARAVRVSVVFGAHFEVQTAEGRGGESATRGCKLRSARDLLGITCII